MALTSDLHWSISLYAILLLLAHAAKSTGKIRPDRSISGCKSLPRIKRPSVASF
jgi:hypothetical protein